MHRQALDRRSGFYLYVVDLGGTLCIPSDYVDGSSKCPLLLLVQRRIALTPFTKKTLASIHFVMVLNLQIENEWTYC